MIRKLSILAVLLTATWCLMAAPRKAIVLSVVDGDTIYLSGFAERVRLADVNAPETGHGRPAERCHEQATNALTRLLPAGTEVEVLDTGERSFKRPVVYIWSSGGLVQSQLLLSGWVKIEPAFARKHAYFEQLKSAQDVAVQTQRGLWGPGCR